MVGATNANHLHQLYHKAGDYMQKNINLSNKPQISEQTMKEMAEFFLKTSIPRIIESEQKKVNPNA